ncbi:MAG TPA: glutathione S-transferase [Steroidobacteraceae bacterium]|jgi:glutathione S-transferase|nr:glutathione S-transferase [Steroidobacteraceae bacterium]
MITVHHLNNSRSQRVLWLLEELGCEYQVVKYQRDPATLLAPPELKRIHPLGKSPVITDGAHTLAESGAIIEYLLDRYGDGRLRPPAGSPERLRYNYWLHYAEGSAMPPLLLKLVFQRLPRPPVPALIRPIVRAVAQRAQQRFIDPQLRTHMGFWEGELGKSTWFAGEELTGADVQMSFPLEAAAARAGSATGAKVTAFLERIRARPAYRRALAAGGEFQLAR